jgi:hypothetical protein
VICELVYWDKEREKPTSLAPGEFERLYAEKTKILIYYQNGINPLEIVTLPALIQHLEDSHPGCSLRLESIQNAAGGAIVTLVLDDTGNKTPKQVKQLQARLEEAAQRAVQYQREVIAEKELRLQLLGQVQAFREALQLMSEKQGQTFNFNAPVTGNISGQVTGNVIYNAGKAEEVNNLLSLLAERLESSPSELPAEQHTELENRVKEMQIEMAKPAPDETVLSRGLQFVRDVMARAIGSGIADHWKDIYEKFNDVMS